MENFAKTILNIVTTYNDEICYVKHVLDPLCVFFTLFGWGGGGTKGCRAHNLLMQFSGLSSSKMVISETEIFPHFDHPKGSNILCKACFGPSLCVFHPIWVGGGGTKESRAHNLLMQFSGLSSSKMVISETDFFHTLTIQNDQISYVKHVLAPLHVLFTPFGCVCGGGGGLPRGVGHTTCLCIFRPRQLKNGNFRN